MKDEKLDKIVDMICTKSVLKQDIYKNTTDKFQELKKVAFELVEEITKKVCTVDKRIVIDYTEKGKYEFRIKVAGDVLVFHQHTNVFKFDDNHNIWKTNYLQEDPTRSYCGIINIYNFLSDSFKYNRINDLGYMIGRVFLNNENHFITEGKRKLGFLYNDFVNATLEKETMKAILEDLILHILEFDLYTPPYEQVKETSVYEVKSIGDAIQLKTGKRLGFQFNSEKS
jgi:hypothetical protein